MRRTALLFFLLFLPACTPWAMRDTPPPQTALTVTSAPHATFAPGISPAHQAAISTLLEQKPGAESGGVRLQSVYPAASGQDCALLTDGGDTWMACHETGGPWNVRPSLLPVDSVFGR